MKLLRLVGAATLALAVAVLPAAPTLAAVAPSPPPTFYGLPYTPMLYNWAGDPSLGEVSFQNWVGWGAPSPVRVPTEFVHYTWAPQIWAVSYFGSSYTHWHLLTPQEWAYAGYPAPRVAGWMPGTHYIKWASSPEIFANQVDSYHLLSFGEWQALGYPEPMRNPGGYVKLTWAADIIWTGDVEHPGRALPLTFARWVADGSPTPRERDTYPGDTWCWMPPEWMVNDQSPVPHYPEGGILYDGAAHTGYVPKEYWARIGIDIATTPEC